MLKIKIFCNVFLILFCLTSGLSQRFDFGVRGGLTFSQVNGDNLAGYDKLGIEVGVKSIIHLKDRWDLSLELLYSQRGSSDEVTFSGGNSLFFYHMDYVSIPILIEFKDWVVKVKKSEYYKVHVSGGLAYGRLFDSKSSDGYGEDFATGDLSFILGADYFFDRHFSVNLRYTRSIIPLDEVTFGAELQNIIPHHVTIGVGYNFN